MKSEVTESVIQAFLCIPINLAATHPDPSGLGPGAPAGGGEKEAASQGIVPC